MAGLTFTVPCPWQVPEQAYAIDEQNAIVVRRTRVGDGTLPQQKPGYQYRYAWADLRDLIRPVDLNREPPEFIGGEWHPLTMTALNEYIRDGLVQ